MSVARGFGLNGKSFYTNVAKPQIVYLNFTVTPANGLGVTSVKSNGYVNNVFMHTSTTPTANNGVTNPNPQNGYAVIQFKNNFNYFLSAYGVQAVPQTSTTTTSLTAGNVYVITSLGTTTAAQWTTAGVPAGFTPAVGLTFVSLVTASIGGNGTVGIPGIVTSPILSVVGTPSTMIANSNIAGNAGAIVVVQFAAATSSSVTTLVPTAPTTGSVVSMAFHYDGSSVTIDGL